MSESKGTERKGEREGGREEEGEKERENYPSYCRQTIRICDRFK